MKNDKRLDDNIATAFLLGGVGMAVLALGAFDWRLGLLLAGAFFFETGRRYIK